MKIGYARVSTVGQDYETQIQKLKAEGCEKIFSEKQSGKNASDREELKASLAYCRDGDILVVTKLDRLARSMADLWKIVSELESRGVSFKVLDQSGIDTSAPTGKLLFNILGAISEFERDLINARTSEGRKAAQARGVKFGRKISITPDIQQQVKTDLNAGILSKAAIAKKYEISRQSVYRIAS